MNILINDINYLIGSYVSFEFEENSQLVNAKAKYYFTTFISLYNLYDLLDVIMHYAKIMSYNDFNID